MTEQVDIIDSKFRMILIAAKRARQLQGGAKPMIHTISRKPTRIAMDEMRAGVIRWELTPIIAKAETPADEETEKKKAKK